MSSWNANKNGEPEKALKFSTLAAILSFAFLSMKGGKSGNSKITNDSKGSRSNRIKSLDEADPRDGWHQSTRKLWSVSSKDLFQGSRSWSVRVREPVFQRQRERGLFC